MTPLFLTLALLQTPPEPAPPPERTPTETLEGLEQIYATTCGQTGILYHAYDDLCDGLRNQIRIYRNKIDKDEARTKTARPKPVSTPQPSSSADRPAPKPQ